MIHYFLISTLFFCPRPTVEDTVGFPNATRWEMSYRGNNIIKITKCKIPVKGIEPLFIAYETIVLNQLNYTDGTRVPSRAITHSVFPLPKPSAWVIHRWLGYKFKSAEMV